MTDRGFWLAGTGLLLNVRRLMYQSLIWSLMAGYDPRRLRTAFYPEDSKGLSNALVDGVRGDMKLRRDFLGTEVPVDEQETVELPGAQPGDSLSHQVPRSRITGSARRLMRSVRIVQCNTHPAKHAVLPSRVTLQFMLSFEL